MSGQKQFYDGDDVVLPDGRDGRVFAGDLNKEDLRSVISGYGYGSETSPKLGDVGVVVADVSPDDVTARKASRGGACWIIFVSPDKLIMKKPSIHHELKGKDSKAVGELARKLAGDLSRVIEHLAAEGFTPFCANTNAGIDLKSMLHGISFKKTTITTV